MSRYTDFLDGQTSSAWIAIGTTTPTRMNIFCVEKHWPRHVASVTSSSTKNLAVFRTDVELMRMAPELFCAARETAAVLEALGHLRNPQLMVVRQRLSELLTGLQNSIK